jgi:tRNA modification GTPase
LAGPPPAFAFGRIGEPAADEVVLAATGPAALEVHCHGGPRVVGRLLDLLRANGIDDRAGWPGTGWAEAIRLLPLARTTRTAGILLNQFHGAYDRAERATASGGPDAPAIRATLRRNATVGRHLIDPWRVAIAGLPNAGKSTLLNALAGFARSVVSPVPGTTRDIVSVSLAFDGWPVDVIDTAGLCDSVDAIEAEGVGRARAAAAESDLVLWVVDAAADRPNSAQDVASGLGVPADRVLVVFNKTDVAAVPPAEFPGAVRVAALTGAGLAELVARIVSVLVPDPPGPGDPVPFTPELCARWSTP